MESIPVLIIGAGPSGLNIANLLLQYGIPCRIIDQKMDPIHTSNALGIQPRSLEMWKSMGLADAAISLGKKIVGLSINNKKKNLANITYTELPTEFNFILGLPQSETEMILTKALAKQGGHIERNCKLIQIKEMENYVVAEIASNNGKKEKIKCNWLIATDGLHSSVRNLLNLDFIGKNISEKFIMIDAVVKTDLDLNYFHIFFSSLGPLMVVPLNNFTRIIAVVTHDQKIEDFKNPSQSDFEYVISTRTSIPIQIIDIKWKSHFTVQHRKIKNYRHNNIFFVGDSAHVHSPVGGQGMNMGMQDGYNLAWKLALVIKGKCEPGLLDSYHEERSDVAKKVLSFTTKMTALISLKNKFLICLRNYLLKFLLKQTFLKTKIMKAVSELSLNYQSSILIKSKTSKLKAGQRTPNVVVTGFKDQEIQLYDLLKGLKHQLILFTGLESNLNILYSINDMINKLKNKIDDFFNIIVISSITNNIFNNEIYWDKDLKAHKVFGVEKGGMVIVRPDQYMGLCVNEIKIDYLEQYLKKLHFY